MPMTKTQWFALLVSTVCLFSSVALSVLAVVSDVSIEIAVEMIILAAVFLLGAWPFAKFALTDRPA